MSGDPVLAGGVGDRLEAGPTLLHAESSLFICPRAMVRDCKSRLLCGFSERLHPRSRITSMKKKTPAHPSDKKTKQRRDRDLAVLAALGVKVRCSPSADYLHPLAPALAAEMRKWLQKHRLKAAGVVKRAQLSREALRKLVSGWSWFSLDVAARICGAMGLDFIGALLAAARRCGRLQRKKCQL